MRDEGPQPGRELLAAYRDERGPSPAAAARLLAALEREIADDLSHGAGPSGQVPGDSLAVLPRPRAPRRWLAPALVLAAAAALAALALMPRLGARVARDHDPAAAFQRRPDDPAAARERAPSLPTTPLAPTTATSSPAPEAPVTPPRPRPEPPSLADEMQRMRPAQQALAAGDPQAALRQLDDYARAFPGGRLHEESLALRAIARCQLDEIDAAADAAELLRARPDSMSAERVRGACKLAAPATKTTAPGHPSPTASHGGP